MPARLRGLGVFAELGAPMDEIRIESLELECIVGVRPRERRRKQLVRLDLTLELDLSAAGRTGRIQHTCDYDRVADEVIALLRFREYQLIEVACEEISALLLGVHPALTKVEVRLEKPEALRGRARNTSIHTERKRDDFPQRERPLAELTCNVLLTTHEAGLYVLTLPPRAELNEPLGVRTLSWLVAGQLERRQQALTIGHSTELPPDEPLGLINPGPDPARLFLCSLPPLAE